VEQNLMLEKEKKTEIILKWSGVAENTGSSETQIGLITARISKISAHLDKSHKDHSSRLGLVKLVGKRRRLMRYLERTNAASFKKMTELVKNRAVA
jgi:small subunit ribosomal protein S15